MFDDVHYVSVEGGRRRETLIHPSVLRMKTEKLLDTKRNTLLV